MPLPTVEEVFPITWCPHPDLNQELVCHRSFGRQVIHYSLWAKLVSVAGFEPALFLIPNQVPYQARRYRDKFKIGALGQIRTDTLLVLNQLTLPIGLQGRKTLGHFAGALPLTARRIGAIPLRSILATCRGFEPLSSAVTGRRNRPDYANKPETLSYYGMDARMRFELTRPYDDGL